MRAVKSAEEMIKQVSKYPAGIGHVGTAWEIAAQDPVKALRINGKTPSSKNLADRSYPYYRQLSIVSKKQPSESVLTIVDTVLNGQSFKRVAEKYQLLPMSSVRE